MKNISFFRKIKLFLLYRKTIKSIERELELQYNLRIDNALRLYTVLNIPEDVIEEPYNLRKQDIDAIAQSFITDYTKQLSTFLNNNGLSELYDFYDISKLDKYNYLIIYGFSLFKSNKFIYNLYRTIGVSVILLIIFILFKTFIH